MIYLLPIISGAYIIGALSGYGLMSACGARELLVAYVTDSKLPNYASVFDIERYKNTEYRNQVTV